jgi:hypothetical protein
VARALLGGLHRRFRLIRRRVAALVTLTVVLALTPTLAAFAGDRAPQDGYTTNLTITKVPNETTRASIVLHGTTFPFATLQVGGGAVPVTDFAGIDGTFAVEVPLVPSCANKLTVTAVAQGNKASTTVTVKQRLANPTTTVTGRVLDVVTRVPVSGARVSFGSRYARTSATGGYTLTGIPDGQVACRSRRPAG